MAAGGLHPRRQRAPAIDNPSEEARKGMQDKAERGIG
jgi:hypothetical protein